ncbi:MAG: addiction module protein [bacterium]|nr:addiction module protein [bacterium]
MNTTVEKIMTQALQIPPEERAVISEQLLSSLETVIDLDVEVAWQEEIQRRLREVDKGNVVCIPWEVVRERLRRNIVATT